MHKYESDYKSTMFYDVIRYAFKTDKYLWSTEWDDDDDYYEDDEILPISEKTSDMKQEEPICNDDYDANGNIVYY